MLIPLGFWAASAGGGAAAGSFDLLETQVLASSAASVTFSSLSTYAADYKHLQIRVAGRFLGSYTERTAHIRLNGITTGDYNRHYLVGTGSSVVSGGLANSTSIAIGSTPANNGTGSAFSASVIDILDPFETTKFTTIRALSGNSSNAVEIALFSGAYRNTAAITSVEFFDLSTNQNWAIGSRFSLYGIKAGA